MAKKTKPMSAADKKQLIDRFGSLNNPHSTRHDNNRKSNEKAFVTRNAEKWVITDSKRRKYEHSPHMGLIQVGLLQHASLFDTQQEAAQLLNELKLTEYYLVMQVKNL